jgi:SAM-dependent methyltransferase
MQRDDLTPMAEITSGLRSILSSPVAYRLLQRVFGGYTTRRDFVARFVREAAGDRILEVGCGPAQILSHLKRVQYVGYDPNEKYIRNARMNYDSERAQFFAGQFGKEDVIHHQPFDIGLLLGVLHHLNDEEASNLVGLMRSAIKPGGRLVTLDNVLINRQNPIARKLIEWDRGKHVRTAIGYRQLVGKHFDSVSNTEIHKSFPPYTLYVMECR